eukprot:2062499-Amphidinium_carterae.7
MWFAEEENEETEDLCLSLEGLSSASDGVPPELTPTEKDTLNQHCTEGHLHKSKLCRACFASDAPVERHGLLSETDKKDRTRHVDIAGPLPQSLSGHACWLQCYAYGFPSLVFVEPLKNRTSAECVAKLQLTVDSGSHGL